MPTLTRRSRMRRSRSWGEVTKRPSLPASGETGAEERRAEGGVEARRRHRRQDRLEEGLERAPGLGELERGGARPGVRVEDRELELVFGRLQVDEEVVDLVEHLGGARVAPVDLVDDDDRRQARLERLF